MLALIVSAALTSHGAPALVEPSCDARLANIHDARLTLQGLLTSERRLRRRHARAQTRLERRQIERVLEPISTQALALTAELERQERAYIRCVEAQLDARPSPARGR